MKKRILSLLCCITMLVSALWIMPAQTAEAADGTISITATETRYVIDGGYINLTYSGAPSDYSRQTGNILTQEYIDAGWVTFEGGLTAEDILNGHLFSGLATNNVLQFNWRDRGAAFTDGSSFTVKQGAPINYEKTDGSIGTVTLDANYTISFEATDNAEKSYNIVRISKEVEKGTISITSTGVDFVIDTDYSYNYMNISFANTLADYASAISGGYINADYVNAGYMTLDGMTTDDLFGSMRKGRIETSNIIQLSYDMRESGFPQGATITWHKGAPLYYTDTNGVKSVVRLDAEYVFTVGQPVKDTYHNSMTVTKVYVPENKGEMGVTGASGFVIESSYNYINISVDSVDDWSTRSDAGYINADYVSAGYITFDGGLTEEDFLNGLKIGRLEVNGIIQLNYELRESGFPIGSSFTWHKGAPIYYKNTSGGVSYKTLDATYKFISTEGTDGRHNNFTVEKVIIPEHRGEVSVTSEGVSFNIDTNYNYNFINIAIDNIADYSARMDAGYIDEEYVETGYITFADGLTSEIFFQGMRSGRLETSNILQLCYDMRESGFPDGSSFTLKKGAPLYYKDTNGGVGYVTLDADYKFTFRAGEEGVTHNNSTVELVICSVQGHTEEEIPAVDGTCMAPGYTAGTKCSVCGETVVQPVETDLGAHDIVHFDAVEPGCHSNGNQEYWYCKVCDGFWTDAECTQLTNSKNVTLPATGSKNLVHFDAVEPGCHYDGNVEYWYCPDCQGFWTDALCTVPANSKRVVLPRTGEGKVTHVEAKEPTCTAEGNVEYWFCADCEGFWTDEACTQLTNSKNVLIGKKDHKKVQVAAVAATTSKTGLTAGIKCSECGTIFEGCKVVAKVAKPSATKIKKATGGKKKITIKFKKVSGISGYEIQIATKKNMKKGLKTKVVKAGKAKYVAKKLKAKKTYYVRIRTYKMVNGEKVVSAWSKKVKVKTK